MYTSKLTVTALASRSDTQWQKTLADMPTDAMSKMLLDDELKEIRQRFVLGVDDPIPKGIYSKKVSEWYEKVIRQQIMPNYYVCCHPDCAELVENWMLREHFDSEYRTKGLFE